MKAEFKDNMHGQRAETFMAAQERKHQIQSQKMEGYRKMNEFVMRKREYARADINNKADGYRNEIGNLEMEGDDLEKLETELLRKLQETQKMEREAFTRLEDAIVNGSIPPPMRAAGGNPDASQQDALSVKQSISASERQGKK